MDNNLKINQSQRLVNAYLDTVTEGSLPVTKSTFHIYFQQYDDLNPVNVMQYLNSTKKYSDSYRRKKHYIFKSLYNFMVDMDVLDRNPLARRKPPALTTTQHHIPLEPEIAGAIMDEWEDSKVIKLIKFQMLTGLRSAEVLMLKDYKFENDILYVKGKGAKTRKLELSPVVVQLYYKVIEYDRLGLTSNYGKLIYKWCRSNNYIPFTSHQLRATYATQCYRQGTSIAEIGKALGHANLDNTKNYIQDLRASSVAKIPIPKY